MAKIFPIPKKVSGVVASTEYLNGKILEIKITPKQDFNFYAGQFISLKVGETTFRPYSICSVGKNNDLCLVVAVGHNGIGANYLKNLKVGDNVDFVGSSGRFILPEVLLDNLVFIATGTGLAPIIAMLNTLSDQKCSKSITLYFGIRDRSEAFYLDKISAYKYKLKNFTYCICYSREGVAETSVCKQGRVTTLLKDCYSYKTNTQIFICGNPKMVAEVNNILDKAQVPKENVFHEKFTISLRH